MNISRIDPYWMIRSDAPVEKPDDLPYCTIYCKRIPKAIERDMTTCRWFIPKGEKDDTTGNVEEIDSDSEKERSGTETEKEKTL